MRCPECKAEVVIGEPMACGCYSRICERCPWRELVRSERCGAPLSLLAMRLDLPKAVR